MEEFTLHLKKLQKVLRYSLQNENLKVVRCFSNERAKQVSH